MLYSKTPLSSTAKAICRTLGGPLQRTPEGTKIACPTTGKIFKVKQNRELLLKAKWNTHSLQGLYVDAYGFRYIRCYNSGKHSDFPGKTSPLYVTIHRIEDKTLIGLVADYDKPALMLEAKCLNPDK